MWRTDEEINADLDSGRPERIVAGIRDIDSRRDLFDEFVRPPLTVAILRPLGDDVPEETLLALMRLIVGYDSFEPALSLEDKYRSIGLLSTRYGRSVVACQGALELKVAEDPVKAVTDALNAVRTEGLNLPRHVEGAQYFLSYLLDGSDVIRNATLRCLRDWPNRSSFRDLKEYLRPQLEPPEISYLAGY